jgi:hypothetical protein
LAPDFGAVSLGARFPIRSTSCLRRSHPSTQSATGLSVMCSVRSRKV